MITARAGTRRPFVDVDRVSLTVAGQSCRALRHHDVRAEFQRLRVRAAGQVQPRDAGRKAQVVLDP